MLLAVLVSTKLRAGGSRHAFGPRQLPSKPCRPLRAPLFYHANDCWSARWPLSVLPQLRRYVSSGLEVRLLPGRSSPRIEQPRFAAQEHTLDPSPIVHTSSPFAHIEQYISYPESCPWLPGSLFRNAYRSHTPAKVPWNCCFGRLSLQKKDRTARHKTWSLPALR